MRPETIDTITFFSLVTVTGEVFQNPLPGSRYNPIAQPIRVFIDTNDQSRHAVTEIKIITSGSNLHRYNVDTRN